MNTRVILISFLSSLVFSQLAQGQTSQDRKAVNTRQHQSREIQELYRRLAKKVHPDLAVDEKDRERRTRIMAEVNKAYAEGDIERLEAILEEWEASPDAIEGEDVGSRLVRTIRMIARVKRRLGQIEKEVQALTETELYELKIRINEAAQEERDLIEELAAGVDAQIERARARLEELRAA